MNRITTYIRQSLQDIYPPEEVKALSMLICCDMLGLDALDIYMGKDIILSECKQRELENIIFRLQKNEPIQYIRGFAEFCGRNFKVASGVLIPRPETAELVELIVKENPNARHLLDIGTGTGCIAISLDKELPDIEVEAWDISEEALAIARKNNEDLEAEREGRKFFTGNPQDNYPDALDKYRKMMKENKWDLGEDDEELFEYAMHPAQYEAYKSGKAKEDFLADVEKRKAELNKSPLDDAKPKTLTVQVDGQAYRVTVAYGDIDLPADATAKVEVPVGEGQDVPAPLEGKFFLTKNAQETPIKVGDKVKKGDLLCYIEAMKTYNAIRADFDGTVTAICATSGDSVAEDDVLMKIG